MRGIVHNLASSVIAACCLCASPSMPAANAQAGSAALAEIASYAGPDRDAKILAGAQKEGVVNVYTSQTVDDGAALAKASN
jgi:hypothetical protein